MLNPIPQKAQYEQVYYVESDNPLIDSDPIAICPSLRADLHRLTWRTTGRSKALSFDKIEIEPNQVDKSKPPVSITLIDRENRKTKLTILTCQTFEKARSLLSPIGNFKSDADLQRYFLETDFN